MRELLLIAQQHFADSEFRTYIHGKAIGTLQGVDNNFTSAVHELDNLCETLRSDSRLPESKMVNGDLVISIDYKSSVVRGMESTLLGLVTGTWNKGYLEQLLKVLPEEVKASFNIKQTDTNEVRGHLNILLPGNWSMSSGLYKLYEKTSNDWAALNLR